MSECAGSIEPSKLGTWSLHDPEQMAATNIAFLGEGTWKINLSLQGPSVRCHDPVEGSEGDAIDEHSQPAAAAADSSPVR